MEVGSISPNSKLDTVLASVANTPSVMVKVIVYNILINRYVKLISTKRLLEA